jgi:hypothetical protein
MRPVHLQAGFVQEHIREHIASCGSKIGAVVFIKKDHTVRKLLFQQAAMAPRIKNTERGIKASAARAVSNPNLMIVYDIAKHDFRSVNLDTVLSVKAGGKVTRYREVYKIAPGLYELAPIVSIAVAVKVGRVEESKS